MTPDERTQARKMIGGALNANTRDFALFLAFILDLEERIETLEARDATR